MNVNNQTIKLISLISALLGVTSSQVQAATISFSDPAPAGISYEWTLQMSEKDEISFVRYVGVKSWNEPSNPVGLKGWTHTSNWVALEVPKQVELTIQIERQAGVPVIFPNIPTTTAGDSLYPAFSLYSGWENDAVEEDHQFNTLGNIEWAKGICYLAHEENKDAEGLVKDKFVLPPGRYSIAIGGNPPDPTLTGFQGYKATLTTTPVSGKNLHRGGKQNLSCPGTINR